MTVSTELSLFDGVRVVELADDPAGELTGKLFAQMGASVHKVEPPTGARSRHVGPFVGDVADPEQSLAFWFYNIGKRSAVVDLDTDSGRSDLDASLSGADVFISTLQPARLRELDLDLRALTSDNPRLIVVSVTPFGLTGPWAEYLSSDLIGLAASGLLITTGYDDHSLPPIRPGGDQAFHTAAAFAYLGALLALIRRQFTGHGGLIDIAMHDACAVSPELANMFWAYPQVLVQRQTCRHAQPLPTQPANFQCADGRYIHLTLILADLRSWRSLVAWMDSAGIAADLTDDAYLELPHRQKNFPHIQGLLEAFFLLQNAADAYHDGQRHGLAIGILNAPEDLLTDGHFRARDFFVPIHHDGVGDVQYPGVPYRFSSIPEGPLSPAPQLGSGSLSWS